MIVANGLATAFPSGTTFATSGTVVTTGAVIFAHGELARTLRLADNVLWLADKHTVHVPV